MVTKLKWLFFIFLVSINGFTQTLNDYLVIAAENNPELRATYLQYLATLEKIPQVNSIPDPQLSFSFFIMPMERYMGRQIGNISIMQMFPWYGTHKAAKDEMSFMAKAKLEEFNETKSMLFYEVKVNWYALLLLEKEIAVVRENIELLNSIKQIAIMRFESGGEGSGNVSSKNIKMSSTSNTSNTMSGMGMGGQQLPVKTSSQSMPSMSSMENMKNSGNMVDILRIEMETNELVNKKAFLEDSKIIQLITFNKLLNREKNSPVILPDTIPLESSLNNIADSIISNNPMLRMLKEEENSFLSQIKMRKKMTLPMIGIGLQYDILMSREDNKIMGGLKMLMPMATVTLPVWRKKYSAYVKESVLMHEAVTKQREEITNQLQVSYQEALKKNNDAIRRINLYKEQLSLAKQSLDLLVTQYSVGEKNIEDVLKMEQQLLDYHLKYLQSIVDANISIATIERLLGR